MSNAIRTYKKPRYKPEDYIGFTMPNGDMDVDMRNHTSHLVMCRKQHECWNCGATIERYDHALGEKGFLDGEPVNCWTCLDCVDEYMDMMNGTINQDDMFERWKKRYEANRDVR